MGIVFFNNRTLKTYIDHHRFGHDEK